MSDTVFNALVVDDDPIVRKMVAFALENEGFQCTSAVDGADAFTYFSARHFDLVVTDLCMPKSHGHALAVKLLAQKTTSVIVVHTGLEDLRLTKDLLNRGVEDIIYKPTNYAVFAAKIRILIERRIKAKLEAVATVSADPRNDSHESAPLGAADNPSGDETISIDEFEARLSTVRNILPLSQAAIMLLDEVRKDEATVSAIAGLIQRDATLTADVLRLANSAFFKRTSGAILDIEEAITRIGMKRLGELAVATSAMGALNKSVVPWFDKDLASQRSLAGGIAVSRLLDATGHKMNEEGMVLAAVMYPLGRVILGTLFPSLYEQMLATSRKSLVALRQLESDLFPKPQSAATARVLAHWGLPKEVYGPLAYTAQTFSSISCLSEPSRSNVYLVKTGILIGQLGVGQWLPEDLIDFPSASRLSKLGIGSLDELVGQVRGDMQAVAPASLAGDLAGDIHPKNTFLATPPKSGSQKLRYCNLSPEPIDFLRLVLTSIGFELEDVPSESRDIGDRLVVNCMGAPAARLSARRGLSESRGWIMVVTEDLPASFSNFGTILRLPTSCGALRAACEKLAQAPPGDPSRSNSGTLNGLGF